MNKDFYNELQFLYVSLTERFSKYSDYRYDGFYKCYNRKYFFLRDEKREFLEKLSTIKIGDIYSSKYKEEIGFPQRYLDSLLVFFHEEKVCIIDGLGQIILYYILFLLKLQLETFINELDDAKERLKGYVTSDENFIYFDYVTFFENWAKKFEGNNDMQMLIHLFTKTNSNIITISFSSKIEINFSKIKEMYSRLEYFNFMILQ
ncbi:hypothetical protein [Chryseobacterium bernardetii]|uniref:hypothetical protein n=1 Tax=Chryseobacterium bernardetii TaxID=1241978 RepID=UPI003AF99B2C